MQDRVPLYPGRIILTPVAGQANTYDMVRADQPTQDGTPLNKATFWKDATAALFGLGVDSVPDDGFTLLSRLNSGLGNEYLWEQTKITENINIGEETRTSIGQNIPDGTELFYSDSYEYDSVTGVYSLKKPTKYIFDHSNWGDSIRAGKYYNAATSGYSVLKYQSGGSWNGISTSFTAEKIGREVTITTNTQLIGYVNSSSPDAYPPSEPS